MATPAVDAVRGYLRGAGRRAWLVGGTVRDLLLGKSPYDIDLATEGDPRDLARAFADSVGGSFFTMSEEFKACRVLGPPAGEADRQGNAAAPEEPTPATPSLPPVTPVPTWDFVALRGDTIEADLQDRDFTVNAMAIELPGGGAVIDPLGGRADLKARRLTPVNSAVFDHDPLRLLRAVRLEKSTGFKLTHEAEELVRSQATTATNPAVERIFAELVRLLEAPGAAAAIRRLDELDLLEVLFPELHALKGIQQNEYHHLDVFEHTLANCEALDRVIADPAAFFPAQGAKLKERSRRPVAGDAGWRFVMSFASLMHDVAKPYCRFTDTDGQARFFEHDRLGAEIVAGILGRLKSSTEVTRAVTFLVGKHMRFEGLIQQQPPSSRARLRYLRATEPFTPELIMLSVSDRLSVRGVRVTAADVEQHLALAAEMMDLYFAEAEAEPLPKLLSGDELMKEFGLEPGPWVGRLLDHIHEEQRLSHVSTREEAVAAAARMLAEGL